MENLHADAGDRLSAGPPGGRGDPAADHRDRPHIALVVRRAHALYRLRLFPRRRPPSGKERPMKILYFAWIRERIGKPGEEIALPASVSTVGELVDWLSARGDEYARAF